MKKGKGNAILDFLPKKLRKLPARATPFEKENCVAYIILMVRVKLLSVKSCIAMA